MARNNQGFCKLTGEEGFFVEAHILPKALTYSGEKGLPFAQGGIDHPPIKRWTSWYDPTIVTHAGEDILAAYDDWGIAELRQHKLVWSGWGAEDSLVADDFTPMPESTGTPYWGIRKVRLGDSLRLRLFFLSILWRAAVSNMREFEEVSIHASDIRRLRRMLVNGDPKPLHFFPISLTQLSTRGGVHNHTPIAQRRPLDLKKENGPITPIFRFYLDGLIVHFYREGRASAVRKLAGMMLGEAEVIPIPTVSFEASWQRENLARVMAHVTNEWPDRLARIPGFAG